MAQTKTKLKGLGERRNIIKLIGEGFSNLFKNPTIIIPVLFSLIISLILMIIGILVLFKILGLSFAQLFSGTIDQTTSSQIVTDMLAKFQVPGTLTLLIILGILFFLVFLIITSYFNGGILGMIKEFFEKKKKTGLTEMHEYGSKFLGRFFLFHFFFNILFMILAILLFLLFLAGNGIWMIILFIILMLALFVFYLFFTLTTYVIVIEDCGVWQGVKGSFSIVGKNFFPLLGLIVLFGIMSGIAGRIPYVGGILAAVIIGPAMAIAVFLFAKERK